MRIIHTFDIAISDDAEGLEPLYGPQGTRARVTIDTMERYVTGRFSIPVSSAENLSFGDVGDVRYISVRADNDFNVTFNGGAEPIACRRAADVTGTWAKFAGEFDVSAVNIANPSATDVLTGVWIAYGSPEA